MIEVPAQIINPVGLDAAIQDMQNYLSANLDWLQLSFGKAYRNEDSEGNIFPEVYVGENEYLNVFASDLADSMLFFDADDIDYDPIGIYYKKETNVKIIFFIDLKKAKDLKHRADENIIQDIENAIIDYGKKTGTWEIQRVEKGIEKVYANFNYNGTIIINYEPNLILTFNMIVRYRNRTICS